MGIGHSLQNILNTNYWSNQNYSIAVWEEGEMGRMPGPNGAERGTTVKSLSYMVEGLQIIPERGRHLLIKEVMQVCYWQHGHKYQNNNYVS